MLVWLGGKHSAVYIDGHLYWAWTLWLLSYAAVTAAFGVTLVYSSQSRVHDISQNPRDPDHPRDTAANRKSWLKIWWATRPLLLPEHDDEHYRARLYIKASKWIAVVIVFAYAIVAEVQIKANFKMTLPGEDMLTFSQVS